VALNDHEMDALRLRSVIVHVNTILNAASDCYHSPPSPLLANAVDVRTQKQFSWRFPSGESCHLSNLAGQQNFVRILSALSSITGDPRYKCFAINIFRYYFTFYQAQNGLIKWGGHQFIDLGTLRSVDPFQKKNNVHELKNAFPFYELMFESNPHATRRFIEGFWNAHVSGPSIEINRHGRYAKSFDAQTLWNVRDYIRPEPFSEMKGLSFLSAGNDLIYAGISYFQYTKYVPAKIASLQLAQQYIDSRNTTTHLGSYMYSQPLKTSDPTCDDDTRSLFGDRAQRQLGPELEPDLAVAPTKRRVLEANLMLEPSARTIYSQNALMQLSMARSLGDEGKVLVSHTVEGLLAFARYAYKKNEGAFIPLLTDGTDLSDFVLMRNGYYGKAGTVLKPYPASPEFLLSYTRAYRLTAEPELWLTIKALAKNNGIAEFGDDPNDVGGFDLTTQQSDPYALFAVIDIYWAIKNQKYLALARRIANNIYHQRFLRSEDHNGLNCYVADKDHVYTSLDLIEPYALLALEEAIRGREEVVAPFLNSAGYTEGVHYSEDGNAVNVNDRKIFKLRRNQSLKDLNS